MLIAQHLQRSSNRYAVTRWLRTLFAVLGGGLAAACGNGVDDPATSAQHWAMLDRYCTECHNAAEFTADLSLEAMSPDEIPQDAEIWEKVVRKLRGQMMPPPGEPRPDLAQVEQFVAWMEGRLDAAHV